MVAPLPDHEDVFTEKTLERQKERHSKNAAPKCKQILSPFFGELISLLVFWEEGVCVHGLCAGRPQLGFSVVAAALTPFLVH